MNVLLLMMGGSGTRFGADRPKQYTLIDEKPLFSYIVKRAAQVKSIDRMVIVSHADWLDYVNEWCEKLVTTMPYDVVAGGENRSESVLNGLKAIADIASDNDVVMMHDATHPYIDEAGIDAVIEAVNENGGATLAAKNYDTVYRTREDGFLEKVEPRDLIVAGASPEAFRFGDIYKIYTGATKEELAGFTSAGAIALAYNIPMKVVPTPVLNLKVTYQEDMKLFLELIHTYFFPEQ